MKHALTSLLLALLFTGCGKKSDSAAAAPNPDAVPAGQHLIKMVLTGGNWNAEVPRLSIHQETNNTLNGRLVYPPTLDTWARSDDGHTKTLRLAYRDTAFALHFYCGTRTYSCSQTAPTTGSFTMQVFVDGRDQGTTAMSYTDSCGDHGIPLDTKNLR